MGLKKVDIVVPAYNEEQFLEENILYLYDYLKKNNHPFEWRIIIGENGSKDKTYKVAKSLSEKYPRIEVVRNEIANRDLILKKIWSSTDSDILMYTDADMSTHPKHINELINAIEEGNDIAVGSRLKKGAKVRREKIRVFLSAIYNKILLPVILPIGVKDAQCGFKAINQKTAKELLPKLAKNTSEYSGYLDTELLAVAFSKGYKIIEIPVLWEDKRESTMSVWKNVPKFLKSIFITRYKILTGFYK